jgi:hypothetical protein
MNKSTPSISSTHFIVIIICLMVIHDSDEIKCTLSSGVSLLSKRSLVAVFCFLTTALIISIIRYHVTLSIFTDESLNPQLSYEHLASANVKDKRAGACC